MQNTVTLQSLWVLFRSRSCRAWQICSRPGRHGETRSSTTTFAQKPAVLRVPMRDPGAASSPRSCARVPWLMVRCMRSGWSLQNTRRNKVLEFRSRSLLRFCCFLQNTATRVAPVEQFGVLPAAVFSRAGALLHEMLRRPMLDCVSIVEAAVSPRLEGSQFHTDMVLF